MVSSAIVAVYTPNSHYMKTLQIGPFRRPFEIVVLYLFFQKCLHLGFVHEQVCCPRTEQKKQRNQFLSKHILETLTHEVYLCTADKLIKYGVGD